MQHPDEHTLSLFALREGLGTRLRESVERHLADCHGCRSQVEELEEVYAHAEQRLVDEVLSQPQAVSESLTPSAASIAPERNVRSIRLSVAVGGALQRFVDFARRRPIATGVGTLAFASLAFLGINAAWEAGKGLNESQPAFVRVNALRSGIEVYSKDNALLWEFPVHVGSESETPFLSARTMPTSLLGNGKTQVVTSAPFDAEGRLTTNVLRAYDQKGNLLWNKALGQSIVFRGAPYLSFYGMPSLATVHRGGDHGRSDIFVSTTNERSPCAVVGVGPDSRTLGEYWHFGHMPWIGSGHLNEREGEVLFSYGINDVADRVDSSYPVIVVLDPRRIVGQTESTVTPGFGFAPSQAELFYIRTDQGRLPIPASETQGKTGFYAMKEGQDGSLTFITKSGTRTGLPYIFYTFDQRMRLLEVWLDDTSRRVLTEEILGSGSAVEVYLQELRGAVRYWDGKIWQTGFTPVAHDQTPR